MPVNQPKHITAITAIKEAVNHRLQHHINPLLWLANPSKFILFPNLAKRYIRNKLKQLNRLNYSCIIIRIKYTVISLEIVWEWCWWLFGFRGDWGMFFLCYLGSGLEGWGCQDVIVDAKRRYCQHIMPGLYLKTVDVTNP